MTIEDGPFIVFGGNMYYPQGGAEDIIGVANNIEAAKSLCAVDANHANCIQKWYNILDVRNFNIIGTWYEEDDAENWEWETVIPFCQQ